MEKRTFQQLLIIVCLCSCAVAGFAQGTKDRLLDKVQFHGFASQGFAWSDNNNWLTMDTSKGSFALTDFGFNASSQLTDKFRVGAQVYDRNVGRLGNWQPELDWAVADYRVKDWFGVRGGKVKTALGLYNDTQDMEFLHTWALMPSSTYPVDVRGDTIAHVGGDLYGNIATKKAGTWSYTVYGGYRQNDPEGGYLYGLSSSSRVPGPNGTFHYVTSQTKKITNYGGPVYGADLRWTTPVKGLLVGASYLKQDITTTGSYLLPQVTPYKMITFKNPTAAYYVEYSVGGLKLAGEYRREIKKGMNNSPVGTMLYGDENTRSGYVSAAYRFNKWLELGTYQSRFVAEWGSLHSDPANHIYDQVVTARFDPTQHIDIKAEGHFIDGAMINSGTSLTDGSHVQPVLAKSGAPHEEFLKDYLQKSDVALQTYYRSLAFTGKGTMPRTLGSDAEVVSFVARTKGAIGYVGTDAATSGVKVLNVK